MEGKGRIDERQMKETEDKETSSQHGSGFHKNSDELITVLGDQQSGSSFNQIAAEGVQWWSKRMENMSPEEFQQFYAALGILRGRVQTHLQQRIRIRDSNSGETSTSSSSTSSNGRARRRRR
ncbi:hypothetical protein SLEP1_g6242 [Rubroshorea leprosula]|uniref:Uncharacterized protein n=1 Tax=Rubroshorea leprosula TaxID=152421 RepID=A0AAV5I587_9ROSI|nr:hypothetical protein SLEP1_g6242 [Rubroshorea leprosula]